MANQKRPLSIYLQQKTIISYGIHVILIIALRHSKNFFSLIHGYIHLSIRRDNETSGRKARRRIINRENGEKKKPREKKLSSRDKSKMNQRPDGATYIYIHTYIRDHIAAGLSS